VLIAREAFPTFIPPSPIHIVFVVCSPRCMLFDSVIPSARSRIYLMDPTTIGR
jgi:hypothetical protein